MRKSLLTIRSPQTALLFALFVFSTLASSLPAQQATTVEVELGKSAASKPLSGRLLVFFSTRNQQPMNGPDWFRPEPFFGKDVTNFAPGSSILIDDEADACTSPLSKLPAGEYFVQAILHHDFYSANHARGAGNVYCQSKQVKLDGSPIKLVLDKIVEGPKLTNTESVKFVEVESKLLSDFHKRAVTERAMVVLPASYDENPNRRYPVYFDISGFGGTLERLQRRGAASQVAEGQAEFIRVYLTGQCRWGHHVYANSATNGPRGDALVREMVPAIDKQFRTVAEPTARFVGGHSSGGWSSLWLQVSYPESFGGVWSTAPDPVDFRDWQGTNLYDSNDNVFFDSDKNKKPLARFNGRVMATYADFTKMDDALGQGGQIRSFDAVFSPLDENGKPKQCWDRKTGAVIPDVAEQWKKYDISLLLQENWSALEPVLKSKIHVYMGDQDTFYLEGATKLLGERLKQLGSDAVVEIFPGKDHSSLLSRDLRTRIAREMSQQFWKHHPKEPSGS